MKNLKLLIFIVSLNCLALSSFAQTVIKANTNYATITVNGVTTDYPLNKLKPVYYATTVSILAEAGTATGIVGTPYTSITNGNTGVAFTDSTAFKTFIRAGFFVDASSASDITTGTLSDARLSALTQNKLNSIATPIFRNVAARCFVPTTTSGSFTTGMSRSVHFARDNIVNPILVMPNFYYVAANDLTTGAGTIKVAIEYPAGTYTLANENIANSNNPVTFPIGNLALNFNLQIPIGAKFWVRTYQTNAAGIVWYQYQQPYVCPTEEGFDFSGTDKTTSGTLAAAVKFIYGPSAILSRTLKPSVAIVGDSREEAGAEIITDASYATGITERNITYYCGYTKFARSGTTQSGWNAATRTYRDQLLNGTVTGAGDGITPYFSHISNEYGVNDLANFTLSQALVANRTAFAGYYPSVKVIGHTILPYVTSTDGWITKANQTVGAIGLRVRDFNSLVRAGISGEYAFWDASDGIDPYRENKWPVTRNPSDAAIAQATFTASISGAVLTVTAVAAGTLNVGDTIIDNLTTTGSVAPSTVIISLGTGTGGTGTYNLNKLYGASQYPANVTSKTMYTGAMTTNDGIHPTAQASGILRDSRILDLSKLEL